MIKNKAYQQSVFDGAKAEETFIEHCKKNGIPCKKSSEKEDIYSHIDGQILFGGVKYSYDLKSLKKRDRRDKNYLVDEVWVEIKNVLGNKGWLYGKSNIIIFERMGDYLCVDRKELVRFIEKTVDLRKVLDYKCLYKIYSRRRFGRKDQVTLVRVKDVLKNCKKTFTIEK